MQHVRLAIFRAEYLLPARSCQIKSLQAVVIERGDDPEDDTVALLKCPFLLVEVLWARGAKTYVNPTSPKRAATV